MSESMVETTSPKVELLDELRAEYDRIQLQLRELSSLIEHSRVEVDKLAQRNQMVATRLTQIEDNFDTVPRSDIKTTYDMAQDARQRLLTMRGQLEKLQSDQANLGHFSNVLRRVLELVEGAEIVAQPEADAKKVGGDGLSAATVIRIVEAQEAERRRLARQMHDGPAQSLTNFILQAEICQRLFDRDPHRASEELNNLKAAASGSFQKVREFITDLRPMMLDDLGLVPTMRRYADSFQEKTGITVQLNITGEERRLEPHREVMTFRGVQELLSNARDYANASRVVVNLDMGVEYVKAAVEDNGRGFDPDEAMEESRGEADAIGLATLRERLELVGGSLEVMSKEKKGSKITLTIPAGTEVY
jgi:two-component system sensor histidine kinase DegS